MSGDKRYGPILNTKEVLETQFYELLGTLPRELTLALLAPVPPPQGVEYPGFEEHKNNYNVYPPFTEVVYDRLYTYSNMPRTGKRRPYGLNKVLRWREILLKNLDEYERKTDITYFDLNRFWERE